MTPRNVLCTTLLLCSMISSLGRDSYLVKRWLEERFSRTNRIGRIHDNDVISAVALGKPTEDTAKQSELNKLGDNSQFLFLNAVQFGSLNRSSTKKGVRKDLFPFVVPKYSRRVPLHDMT